MARLLKNWLDAYMEFTQHSEAPDRFHKWTGIATIAGALRRRVYIEMGYFRWRPNFFIFFVAPAGIVSKSTTVNIGMSLLREVEGINFGPEALTWQSLVKELADSKEEYLVGEEEGEPQYITMSAITVAASELGTFLDPDDRQLISALISLWDGKEDGAWEKWTKKDGKEKIVNPWFHLIGCTTPTWIARNCNQDFVIGGFASRSIFLYADKKRKLVPYPSREMPSNFELQREVLITDLREIAELKGVYELTEDTYKWGEKWYERHYYEEPEHLRDEKFRGYLARKQTHIHKVAMVLAASCRDEMVITAEDLKLADKEVTAVEEYMPKVFGEIGQDEKQQLAIDIFNFIFPHGSMTKLEVYRHFLRVMPYDDFEDRIRSLINTGMVITINKGGILYLDITDYAKEYVEKHERKIEEEGKSDG